MYKYFFITPFPNIIKTILNESILLQAKKKNIAEYNIVNLFDYGMGRYNKIDDYPFGGGDGMVLSPKPLSNAIEEIFSKHGSKDFEIIFPTPDGEKLNQSKSIKLTKSKKNIFICGHYKGIDQRIRDKYVTNEISIGDYVLTGGELPALIILDSIVRIIPGVINNINSAQTDSFSNDLLDSPNYTRPEQFMNLKTPDILLSGNHKKIKMWKLKQREDKTKKLRPDLWNKYIKSGNLELKNGK